MNFKRLTTTIRKKQHQEVLFASIILAFLVFSFFAIDTVRSYRTEVKSTRIATQNLVQVLEHHLMEKFDKIDFRLKDIAAHMSELSSIDGKQSKCAELFFDNRFHQIAKNKIAVVDFFILDQQGKVLRSFDGVATEKLVPTEFYTGAKTTLKTDMPIYSQPIFDQAQNRWLVFMKRDYALKDKSYGGAVVAAIDTESIQSYFNSLNVGEEGVISLFDADLYMVSRKPAITGIIGSQIKIPKFDLRKMENTYDHKSEWDGINRIMSGQQVGDYPFGVIVGLSRAEILSAWIHRTMFNSILILSAFIGYAIFLFRYLETQEALEEHQKQNIHSSKMSALGEMASGIAHEINNPLAIIQAKMYQIRKLVEASEVDRNKVYEHADKLEVTVQRIAKIIKGLRSFSRNSDTDPMALVQTATIIDGTLEFCRARFHHHSVILKVNNQAQTVIQGRESQMAQVVLNLLNNAFDAVSELPEKWVAVDVKELDDKVEIWITDSGKGISDDVVEKMMFPFFTTKDVGKGTGLGLSISKGIVEEHGGELRYNKQSANTCFVISLPKAAVPAAVKLAA